MPEVRHVYYYLHDTLADWEASFALPELHSGRFFRQGAPRYETVMVGATRDPVVSLGGVRFAPELAVGEFEIGAGDLLLLVGGDQWADPKHAAVLRLARTALERGAVVAAICGATIALGDTGLLDDRDHTSNDLGALQAMAPRYAGAARYRNEPVVTAGNLITATGLAAREFAEHIFTALGVMSPATIAAWSALHRLRTVVEYNALMASLPPPPPPPS